MIWSKFQEQAFVLSDQDSRTPRNDILKLYRGLSKSIQAEIDKDYGRYLTTIDPENFYTEMLKFNRLEKIFLIHGERDKQEIAHYIYYENETSTGKKRYEIDLHKGIRYYTNGNPLHPSFFEKNKPLF